MQVDTPRASRRATEHTAQAQVARLKGSDLLKGAVTKDTRFTWLKARCSTASSPQHITVPRYTWKPWHMEFQELMKQLEQDLGNLGETAKRRPKSPGPKPWPHFATLSLLPPFLKHVPDLWPRARLYRPGRHDLPRRDEASNRLNEAVCVCVCVCVCVRVMGGVRVRSSRK